MFRWILGYLILSIHHYMRLSMFCHAGDHLRKTNKNKELVKNINIIHHANITFVKSIYIFSRFSQRKFKRFTIKFCCRFVYNTKCSKFFLYFNRIRKLLLLYFNLNNTFESMTQKNYANLNLVQTFFLLFLFFVELDVNCSKP